MDQTNNVALSMLQTMASQVQMPKTSKKDGSDDFQKLLDKANKADSRTDGQPKAEKPATDVKQEAPAQEEDALTRIKRMLEQHGNAAVFKPDWQNIVIDLNTGEAVATYNPGEWVQVVTDEGVESVPIIELDPWQQQQLQQLLRNMEQMEAAKDPKADAILEATAPDADNNPAALLEKVVAEQTGQKLGETVGELRPQTQEEAGEGLMESVGEDEVNVLDVDQAPQQLFHDVKAAPVKVGEVYDAEKADEPNVAQQIDNGLAQALEKGESMVRIQLNPENLGAVTVEISRSAEGILRVALSAHSNETRGLLERHAGELQGMLSNRTQQNVEVDVQRQQANQQSQNQQNYDGHNGHAQDGQERRRRQQEPASSQDFIQQLRLGLIPSDGDEA